MNYEETKEYLITNKKGIINQITEKLSTILKPENSEEDNKSAWWFHIEEAGWDPQLLNGIPYNHNHPELNDGENFNELLNLMGTYYETSLIQLNLPIEIMH